MNKKTNTLIVSITIICLSIAFTSCKKTNETKIWITIDSDGDNFD